MQDTKDVMRVRPLPISEYEREQVLADRSQDGSYTSKTCTNYREVPHPGNLKPDGEPWILYQICLDPEVVARRGLVMLGEHSAGVCSFDGWPAIFEEHPYAGMIKARDCNTCRYNTSFQRDFGDSYGK